MGTGRSARQGAGATSTIIAVVAMVAIAALLFWLSSASEPATVATVEETTEEASMAEAVPAAAFETNMAAYVGREIRLTGVTLEQMMAPELAWVTLPSGTLFLVHVAPGAGTAEQGSVIDVTGQVMEKTDAVLNGWQQSGVIQNDGQRQQTEFGTHYMEARRVAASGG